MKESTKRTCEPLQTERLANGRRRLLRDLIVEVQGERYTVPAGTETDFSTIPWFGRAFVHWSKVDVAGVVHDWLYQSGYISRRRADTVWRLVALAGVHHANQFQAWAGWAALRIGGWYAWDQYRRDDFISGVTP